MKMGLAVLGFVLWMAQGAYAESLDNYVFQEQPGVCQAVILNGGGQYVVDFTALDQNSFGMSGAYPLKLELAKTGRRTLNIYCQDSAGVVNHHHYYYSSMSTTLEIDVKPGRIYRVEADNVGGKFDFLVTDITDQDGKSTVQQYSYNRMADEQRRVSDTSDLCSTDAIFYNLNGEYLQNHNLLMTMATLNPEDSAASLFAWAMFETLDGDKSSGLDQVLRKDADFWPAYYELGKLALKNAAFSGLLANMENVIRLNPKCSLAYLYKGYALTKLAHYPEAKAAFAQAAELKNPGASLIMSRLQDNMPDQLFEQYNRPMASLGYFVLYGNMGMAEFADTRLSSSAEHEFGLAMGMGNFLLGFETGNIGAMIKDEKLRTLYSDEINEYGVNMKIQMPIENRFLATLGAGYYLLNNFNSNPESMNDQFNTSVKLTAGGDYFFVRNLAAGFEVGYRIGQLKFSETSYTASGVWDSLRTPVTTTDTVDLSGIYGHVGLKWYTW